MNLRNEAGQAMPEYVVVASALVFSFMLVDSEWWQTNVECPGYEDCISAVSASFHNQYQGFSNSITAVHSFLPAFPASLSISSATGDDDSNAEGGGSADIESQGGLTNQSVVTTEDGDSFQMDADGNLINDNGEIVGTYADGVFYPVEGPSIGATMGIQVLDEEGNILKPRVVICGGEVTAFAYQSQVDGRLYDTVELKPIGDDEYRGCQTEGYFKMLSPDGTPDPFAVLYEGYYYPSYLGTPNAAGEVILVQLTVPNEPEEYGENAGQTLDLCLVMPARWDADPSKSDLDAILDAVSAEPPQYIGSAEDFCPSLRTVTEPD